MATKVSKVKVEERIERPLDRKHGIYLYGTANDYPQRILEIIDGSGTTTSVIDKYQKFINGQGFKDMQFYKQRCNDYGLTNDQLLSHITTDYADFFGFAVHVNYNGLGEKVSLSFVPFENCRLAIDDDGGYTPFVVTHPDWGRRSAKPFNEMLIQKFNIYNPNKEVVLTEIQAAGGIEKYKGQIFYYTKKNGFNRPTYPKSPIDPIVTDCTSEPNISTVLYRNVAFNFLPAGVMVTVGRSEGSQQTDNRYSESSSFNADDFAKFQGADKAAKIIHIEVESEEDTPKFIEFPVADFDKKFEFTSKYVQQNIGNRFDQPPVLRGQLVAGKMATSSEIKDATDYYNFITQWDRIKFEEAFMELYNGFYFGDNRRPATSYEIMPLQWTLNQMQP